MNIGALRTQLQPLVNSPCFLKKKVEPTVLHWVPRSLGQARCTLLFCRYFHHHCCPSSSSSSNEWMNEWMDGWMSQVNFHPRSLPNLFLLLLLLLLLLFPPPLVSLLSSAEWVPCLVFLPIGGMNRSIETMSSCTWQTCARASAYSSIVANICIQCMLPT